MAVDRDELQELYTKLTKQQLEFVHNFIAQDFKNAKKAYLNAYADCSPDSAAPAASRLLTDCNIKRCIALELEATLAESKIPLEKKILEIYLARAFYDIADMVNDKGALICTMKELKEKGLSVCIDGIDIKPDKDGGEHYVYKLADRTEALDKLQKYIQMIKPIKQEIEHSGSVIIIDDIPVK
ncbi:MAG: terminase small subunit [Candidatus Omnitrophota bacterium]|jgi:phage terminase small subunit